MKLVKILFNYNINNQTKIDKHINSLLYKRPINERYNLTKKLFNKIHFMILIFPDIFVLN